MSVFLLESSTGAAGDPASNRHRSLAYGATGTPHNGMVWVWSFATSPAAGAA
jgi:hypothetical protein